MKIVDWIKERLEEGVTFYEGTTDHGDTCSLKLKNVGDKTREIFDKAGNPECIDALKKKVRRVER